MLKFLSYLLITHVDGSQRRSRQNQHAIFLRLFTFHMKPVISVESVFRKASQDRATSGSLRGVQQIRGQMCFKYRDATNHRSSSNSTVLGNVFSPLVRSDVLTSNVQKLLL